MQPVYPLGHIQALIAALNRVLHHHLGIKTSVGGDVV